MAGARAGRRARDRRVDARRRSTDRTTVRHPSRAWAARSACRDCDRPDCAHAGGARPRPRSHHAMAMIVLTCVCIGKRMRVRACMQGVVRQGDRARERDQRMREHQQPDHPPRQNAGDLLREERGGGKHGHVGSVSRGPGAFGDPLAVLYRSPDCCGKFATNGNVRALARIDRPRVDATPLPAPRLGMTQRVQRAGVWSGWPLSRCGLRGRRGGMSRRDG